MLGLVALRDPVLLHCRESSVRLLRAGAALLLGRTAVVRILDVARLPMTDSVRRAQREGRLETWRESEGGMLHTVTKAAVYMLVGLFGSLFFEITFLVVFNFRPGNPYRGIRRRSLFCRSRPLPRSFCSGLVAGCEAGSRGTSSAERETTATCKISCRGLLSDGQRSSRGARKHDAGKNRDDGQIQVHQRVRPHNPFLRQQGGTSRAERWSAPSACMKLKGIARQGVENEYETFQICSNWR